jgi:hypothetical protein
MGMMGEAADTALEGEFVPLVEKAVRRDGTVPLRLIAPGWGSSGYYSPDMLSKSAKAFSKGTHMFWNHPTAAEEAERPERDLRDLAATLTSDATWRDDGPAGPGLYADAQVFGGFKESIEELAPHIGVSIRALGRAKTGEAEGRKGPVIESIASVQSVDFVTKPGAGGQILQLFESARQRATPQVQEVKDVTEEEARQLRESNAALTADLGRLREMLILREARDAVRELLRGVELPDVTRVRLAEMLAANPPVKDGALDREAVQARVSEAVKAEQAYLAQVTGWGSGRVVGMGGGSTELKPEELQADLAAAFGALGLSESAVKIAAAGR